MARKRHKKHYSRAERTALREKAEREKRAVETAEGSGRREPRDFRDDRPVKRVARSRDPDLLVDEWMQPTSKMQAAAFRSVLVAALKHRPGLVDRPYIHGLETISREPWLRDPETWRPQGRGLSAAFRSLAAHLLGEYRVSPYLWETLVVANELGFDFPLACRFVARVAQGFSARAMVAQGILPVPLTRRMVHILVRPPRALDFITMVRRAQVLGYGGGESLAFALASTWELGRFTSNEDYRAEVIHWFCRQDAVTKTDVELILEYLDFRCAEDASVPLKGRSIRSLRRDALRYRKERDARFRRPRRRNTEESRADSTRPPRRPPGIPRHACGDWQIVEIRTARQLILEGSLMRHCVATCRGDLRSGTASFWSLSRAGKRRLTIEVDTARRSVETVAGKANRKPRADEVKQVLAWARENGMQVEPYAMPGL